MIQTPVYPIAQEVHLPASFDKSSKFVLQGLKKKYLIYLSKQSLQEGDDNSYNESKASSETSLLVIVIPMRMMCLDMIHKPPQGCLETDPSTP